jgi:hypothetical protein
MSTHPMCVHTYLAANPGDDPPSGLSRLLFKALEGVSHLQALPDMSQDQAGRANELGAAGLPGR